MDKAAGGYRGAFLLILLAGALAFGASAQEAAGGLPPVGNLLNGGEGGLSGTVIILFVMVTLLSLVPGLAMMVTCLPFLIIVFSFVRQALGVQQAPPNMMLMALSMFLTFFIMEPTFTAAWANGIEPYTQGQIAETQAWNATTGPFREFMTARTDPEAIPVLSDALGRPVIEGEPPSFSLLSTAFMLSEIKHAFQIGFVIFLPFLVIDLVVASVLMAVGMMMVPPTVVSLPFKVGFFVLADGWLKITEALLRGYSG
ncbi:MAG: flagellar type III secretion system pore protein FliP [Henriciella sp.]|uniref:flagellar type III secretion system pore protein FliP n=1 Tax=Henriciella sp. TaxID=1968823 RepID=UPI0026034F1E|nr:flagellar type III secretion system pore protein FliP [Henriciella sp.]